MTEQKTFRGSFSTRIGVIAAAAGSAIGLGNIWRFPYITGKYGGASFLIVYLICIAIIGLPIMLAEFVIGRKTQKNAIGAFRELAPGKLWEIVGWMGIISAFMILSFYGVVAGWCMNYIFKSAFNAFSGLAPKEIGNMFTGMITSTWTPILWQLLFMFLTAGIVIAGVKDGIEKYSKILMPLLLMIILALDVRALTLSGAKEGLSFLFKPQWDKLSIKAVFEAMGHAFFTLSLGMGTMITYGSYIKKEEKLGSPALQVVVADTLVALLAGIAIFPAVFTFGINPSEGAGLAFVTLPNIFQQMLGGYIFGILFFILLFVAALTSAISMLEVPVAYLYEEFNVSRKKATIIITGIISVIGILCSLSQGIWTTKFFGMTFMDLLNYLSANWLLPLGGLIISIFVGWKLGKKKVEEEINQNGQKAKYVPLFVFVLKYIAPIAIIIVFLNSLGVFEIFKK